MQFPVTRSITRSSPPKSSSCIRDLPQRTPRTLNSTSCKHKKKCHRLKAATSEEFKSKVLQSEHPWKEWVTFEVGHKEGASSAAVTRRLIGMGMWLMRGMPAPAFQFLVSEVEGLWRQLLDESGFGLKPFDKRFKMLDSMDKMGEKGEAFTRQSENPTPSDPEYPRMIMENRMYQSTKFNKLHLGVAVRQDGLQFVHCSMIPEPEYDMPIFNAGIIGMKCISLAHVDLFPVTEDQTLPEIYSEGMRLLQTESIASNRPNPEWTKGIASPHIISVSPKNDNDSVQFLSYAALLAKVYMKTAETLDPISSPERIAQIKAAHERFCLQSRNHQQFRSAMAKSFGVDWTDAYLRDCFFPLS